MGVLLFCRIFRKRFVGIVLQDFVGRDDKRLDGEKEEKRKREIESLLIFSIFSISRQSLHSNPGNEHLGNDSPSSTTPQHD
jgi:hypothetical protein